MNIDEIMISIGIDPKKAKQGMKDAVDTIKQGTESVVAETKAMATSIEAGLAGVTKIFTGYGGSIRAKRRYSLCDRCAGRIR